MKKLSMVAAVLLLIASATLAHEGSVSLYTSQTATDCDVNFSPYDPIYLSLMYYRSDGGPDGISSVEFMIERSHPTAISFLEPIWPPNTLTLGNIATGIAVTFQEECAGAGQSLVWLGDIQVMNKTAPAGFILKVVGDPRSSTGDGLNVAICGYPNPLQPVIGGWFIASEGACNTGTESRSWGAIKSLYEQ